jgi:putative membrane protein
MELDSFRQRPVNEQLSKQLKVSVWVISAAVLGLVGFMYGVKIDLPGDISLAFLPPFHATLNTIAALSLIMAVRSVKKGFIIHHRRWIYLALGCSFLFLLCYVLYHFTTDPTIYGDIDGDKELSPAEKAKVGVGRTIFLILLISHIALAAFSFPFILLTFVYGFTNQFERHRKLARIIFPVWLYVAVTGPVVYLLLRPYY